MKNMKEFSISLFLILMIMLNLNFNGSADQLSADQIMDTVKDNLVDYENSRTQAEMILIDQKGDEEKREIIMVEKEENDKVSLLMRFLAPKSVEGVTLLSMEDGDKIYLFMPAFQKPRRISGSTKQENFMGTDFSYEDISMDYQSEEYQKNLLKETEQHFLIEVIPDNQEISYKKFLLHINKKHFYMEKVEFFNLEEQLTKILEIKEIQMDENGKITPMQMELSNLIDHHQTKMNIKEIEYNLELSPDFFSIRTIQKPKI
ncbi:MAG: outer membrane lipoprotein-sorting protein [Candidatus Atribacteria bacterium]|nr:outer membrane lipoprotein-sorting protein [Candidatus Atribacteria bacterium]